MILNKLITDVIFDVNGDPIKCKLFRVAIDIGNEDKILHNMRLEHRGRLDLLSEEVYGDTGYQDFLLEFNSVPFFEWAPDEQITIINRRLV